MHLYGEFSFIRFRDKEFEKDSRGVAYSILLKAAQEFLINAAPNVPVDTGMARGSFLNLQQFLRANGLPAETDIPTRPQRILKSRRALRYTHDDGRIFPKTPGSAKKLSTKPKQILVWEGNQLVFNYSSDVRHLNINDTKRQWQSFSRGKEAFQRSLIVDQIDVTKYLDLESGTIRV